MEKKLKIVLAVVTVILLTLVSFIGIYVKKSNVYENIIADYLFNKNLKGSRIIELAVDTSTNEVTYDKDGNKVEKKKESTTTENGEETTNSEEEYTTVKEPVNPQENLTESNYKITKEILENRLNTLNITDYKVKLNNQNGNIIVEIPEDSQADDVEGYLDSIGSFEIVDADDNTVLLNNNDLKKVQVAYNTDTTGTTVYLTIDFNKNGKKKLEDISNKYTMITDENDNTIEKKVTLKMEGEDILSTYFSEPITNGEMQLTVGTASTDVTKVQEYLKNAAGVAMLLNSGKMPIKYTVASERYVKPLINDQVLSIGIYALITLAIISFLYLIFKYKRYGALVTIGSIAVIDLLLLAIRYTNVSLSAESAIAFIALILFNVYIVSNLLKNIDKKSSKDEIAKSMKKGLIESIDMIVIILIISVVFTFMSWSAITSIGLIMFWGTVCIGIAHLIFTRSLLLNSNK